jgi:hypothetical protein
VKVVRALGLVEVGAGHVGVRQELVERQGELGGVKLRAVPLVGDAGLALNSV